MYPLGEPEHLPEKQKVRKINGDMSAGHRIRLGTPNSHTWENTSIKVIVAMW